jgi:nucleoid-associated protein EbfC
MNIQKMLKQAQAMQQKIQDAQTNLETREVEGSAASGAVKLTLSGKGSLTRLAIDAALIDPAEKELLEDLILAAHRDAKEKLDAMVNDTMSSATGGLQLPAGMKLPF